MNSSDPVVCFTVPNRSCRSEHPLGDFGVINHDVTAVTLVRQLHGREGLHTYVAVEFADAGDDVALCLTIAQARQLSRLLGGTVDLYELHAIADALLHTEVTA